MQRNEKHEAQVADLHGARVVVLSEFPDKSTWNTTRLKNFTGDNVIKASFKGRDPFSFRLGATFLANSNTIPDTRELGRSLTRRLRGVPFDYEHPGDQQNDNFFRELAEDEGPAILAMLCRYANKFVTVDNGQLPPITVRMEAAIAEYFEEQDVLGRFVQEWCLPQEAVSTLNDDIKKAFQQWCAQVGIAKHEQPTPTRVITELKSRGFKTDYKRRDKSTGKLDGRRRTRGLALTSNAKVSLGLFLTE